MMRILFYGRLAEAIAPELELEISSRCAVGQIRQRLAAQYPSAAESLSNARALTCVGGSLVRDDYLVDADDRVEFLPPVSGG